MSGALLRSLGVAAVLSLGIVGRAWSHAHLTTAVPAVESTVHAVPAELVLRFSEDLELGFTGLTLTGPGGMPVATGPARLGAADATSLVVPITGSLPAGTYRVDWHALSGDGHKSQGQYVFTLAP